MNAQTINAAATTAKAKAADAWASTKAVATSDTAKDMYVEAGKAAAIGAGITAGVLVTAKIAKVLGF